MMKTKLGFAFVLCCCLMVVFNSCQKEIVEPSSQVAKTPTTETAFIDDLMKDLPNNVVIEPVADNTFDTKNISTWDRPFPIDVPVNCHNTYCFQLMDTYQELQRLANLTCGSTYRRICCCFGGYYRCFIIRVLPDRVCQDIPIIESPDIMVTDEETPVKS